MGQWDVAIGTRLTMLVIVISTNFMALVHGLILNTPSLTMVEVEDLIYTWGILGLV